MDKMLRKIGLSGSSFVPMIIGFGCSVPAIMASRTLASERDRKMTIMLTPFMSCSAKLPIYGMFIAAFFPHSGGLVMLSLYLTGICVAILSGFLLNSLVFRGKPVPFVMELPAYRLPTARNIIMHMWEKAKDFLHKAFTVIFLVSIIVWFLQNFDVRFYMVDASDSVIASSASWQRRFSHRSASAAGRQQPRLSAASQPRKLSSVRFPCLQSAAAVPLIWQASFRRSRPTPSWCSACSIRPASQRWLPSVAS